MRIFFISLTAQCNRQCAYCPVAAWRNNPNFPDALNLKSTIAAIEKINPTHVELTGGEPTLVSWLDELCDYLDSKKIVYLVKSNGCKRCKNQITAWHEDASNPPKNYDKILLILDPFRSEEYALKIKYCEANNIPFAAIGLDSLQWNRFGAHETFFLCPDRKLKECHEGDVIADDVDDLPAEKVHWKAKCANCKAVNDFILFLDNKEA